MSWDRKRRVEEILKEKVALVVQQRLSDPRLGFVTITRVDLTRDRRLAKVYYTVLGEASDVRKTGRALNDAAPRILDQVGPSLRMRLLPELQFHFDDMVEKESRMYRLLEELNTDRDDEEPSRPDDA